MKTRLSELKKTLPSDMVVVFGEPPVQICVILEPDTSGRGNVSIAINDNLIHIGGFHVPYKDTLDHDMLLQRMGSYVAYNIENSLEARSQMNQESTLKKRIEETRLTLKREVGVLNDDAFHGISMVYANLLKQLVDQAEYLLLLSNSTSE